MVSKSILAAGAIFILSSGSHVQGVQCGQSGCSAVSDCQASTCQSCQSGCGTCGGYGIESVGIDVDSLTPAGQSRMLYEASQARLVFQVPEDATIYLLNQQMSTPGAKRTFTVPVNHQEKIYKYEIRVEVIRGGNRYFKKVKLDTVRAGAILAVAVEAPPIVDGEPAQINVEIAPVAEGGSPTNSPSDSKLDQPNANQVAPGTGSGEPPASSGLTSPPGPPEPDNR